MSRIGKAPVVVPTGVEIKINARDGGVKGPKGSLSLQHHPLVAVKFDDKVRSLEVHRG